MDWLSRGDRAKRERCPGVKNVFSGARAGELEKLYGFPSTSTHKIEVVEAEPGGGDGVGQKLRQVQRFVFWAREVKNRGRLVCDCEAGCAITGRHRADTDGRAAARRQGGVGDGLTRRDCDE